MGTKCNEYVMSHAPENRRALTFPTQHRQLKKDVNKAKSLYSISPQSNIYVPIVDVPQRLPDYLHVDRQSEWYTTALISSALETVTLPSRLRPYHDFEASLTGDDGRHNIFELQSTLNPQHPSNEEESTEAETEFDIDLTYDGEDGESAHIFNQVQVWRGNEPGQAAEPTDIDIGRLRKLRLYSSEPMFQR